MRLLYRGDASIARRFWTGSWDRRLRQCAEAVRPVFIVVSRHEGKEVIEQDIPYLIAPLERINHKPVTSFMRIPSKLSANKVFDRIYRPCGLQFNWEGDAGALLEKGPI
jgi:hypothetical protein